MDFDNSNLPNIKHFLLVVFSVLIASCSNSNSDELDEDDFSNQTSKSNAENQILIERASIGQFSAMNKSHLTLALSEDQKMGLREAANDISNSFSRHVIGTDYKNSAVVTWPILSSLPFLYSATHGETREELVSHMQSFNIAENILGFASLVEASGRNELSSVNTAWWQHDAMFEVEFLNDIWISLTPYNLSYNFASSYSLGERFEQIIGEMFGVGELAAGSYNLGLSDFTDTRALILNQVTMSAEFENHDVIVEEFDGVFENNEGARTYGEMLRISGNISVYESSEFIAHELKLANSQIGIVQVVPAPGMYRNVLENLEQVLDAVSDSSNIEHAFMVLPVKTFDTQVPAETVQQWYESESMFLDRVADLRNLDRVGGLYFQTSPLKNRVSIDRNGINLASVMANTATFFEENIYFAPSRTIYGFNTFSFLHNNYLTDLVACDSILTDMYESILVLKDEVSGMILAVITLNEIQGDSVELCPPPYSHNASSSSISMSWP